ncbi:coronafacic acid synthetase [Spongiactinospora gelatinilytica]|uniref:Coronafacic acid synthetase n=1 Tax=Spongiactinospora gelatinilytica TaxID=2666298 RepID=A0A2W2I7Y9_9ACTN|nr:coronafacic acid synthetase [Spongiactinospora gelatinilytica]PZG46584.1 coronafacic acid synthetase [Spongiactinospora gelatinilytica]
MNEISAAFGPIGGEGVVVLATGEATRAELRPVRSRIPSLYADPLAWLVLDAVEDALSTCSDELYEARDEVAVILISPFCTLQTMEAVARSAPGGRVSPLRFAGASPGGGGSLTCVARGFRGPSLTLATRPGNGLPVARTLARSWLRSGQAAYAVVSAHEAMAEGGHRVRTAVLGTEPRR